MCPQPVSAAAGTNRKQGHHAPEARLWRSMADDWRQ